MNKLEVIHSYQEICNNELVNITVIFDPETGKVIADKLVIAKLNDEGQVLEYLC